MSESVPLYYPFPLQVRFWNYKINEYEYGIAYHKIVISVKTGNKFTTNELTASAPDSLDKWDDVIIEYGDWKDLSYNFEKK